MDGAYGAGPRMTTMENEASSKKSKTRSGPTMKRLMVGARAGLDIASFVVASLRARASRRAKAERVTVASGPPKEKARAEREIVPRFLSLSKSTMTCVP